MYKIKLKVFPGKEYSFELEAREIEFNKAIKKYDELKECFGDAVTINQVIQTLESAPIFEQGSKPNYPINWKELNNAFNEHLENDHHIKDMEEQGLL